MARRSHAPAVKGEAPLKKTLFAVLLLAVAAPMFAVAPRTVVMVDEVIKMSKAGVGDEEIIAFVEKSKEPFDVTSDDIIAMTDAKVSRAVMKLVIDESAARMKSDRRDYDRRDSGRTRTVYVSPYYSSYYDPFYDPFWYGYGPRLSLGFGFYGGGFRGGFRGGHGGHFRHR
jgi:hypothetical protein